MQEHEDSHDEAAPVSSETLAEEIDDDREGPLIVAVGDPDEEPEASDSRVAFSGPCVGICESLVGFDNLSARKSLRDLLRGKLFPEMEASTRLAIAEAIVNELMTADAQSDECRSLLDEVSDLLLELDG